jgi:hypothetical protein
MGFFEDAYGINPVKADEMKKAMTQFNQPKNNIWCIFVCTQDKYWQDILTDRLKMLFNKWCFDGVKCSFVCYALSNLSGTEISEKLLKDVDTNKVTLHVLNANVENYFGLFTTSTLNSLKELLK